MPGPLFVVVGAIPEQDYDLGQIIGQERINSRHLALHQSLRLIKPLQRPATLTPCEACESMFATADTLAAHVTKRHPAPPPKTKKAAPVAADPTDEQEVTP